MSMHLTYISSWKYDSSRRCPSQRESCFRGENFFRTEIDEEARMKFVLAHISAEVPEQGDHSTRLSRGEEEQKKKIYLFSGTCDTTTRGYVAAVARCERPFQVRRL